LNPARAPATRALSVSQPSARFAAPVDATVTSVDPEILLHLPPNVHIAAVQPNASARPSCKRNSGRSRVSREIEADARRTLRAACTTAHVSSVNPR
jgi:hypothetical protein